MTASIPTLRRAALAALMLAFGGSAMAQAPDEEPATDDAAESTDEATPEDAAADEDAADDEPSDAEAQAEETPAEEPSTAAPRAIPTPPPTSRGAAVVAERVRPALAVVRCQGARWSIGFALGEPTKVVASTDARDCRRDITVDGLDGQSTSARSVTADGDVAIFILDEDIGLVPLEARTDTPELGEPVYAVSAPSGASQPIVTQGQVAFADGEGLQSDVPHPSGSEGGPLVDGEGRVVAVLGEGNDRGVSGSTPIGPVAERVADVLPTAEDVRQIAYPGFGLSFGIFWDSGDRLLGAAGIFSIDILDRLIVGIELGGYANTRDGMVAQRVRRSLLIGAISVGYRIRVAFGGGGSGTLTPHIGFSFTYDKSSIRTTSVGLVEPSCDFRTETCELEEVRDTVEVDDWRYRPTAGLRLTLGGIEFGYEVYLDTEDIGDTGHRLHAGFRF